MNKKRLLSVASIRSILIVIFSSLVMIALTACGSTDSEQSKPKFVIGAIPDQNISELNRRFQLFSDYLEDETGLNVEYTQSNDYAALVTAFERGEVHLGWFGGLTGVQARLAVPGSEAIAQRPRDRNFHSRFIARSDLDVNSLEDLKGLTFTFGDPNSTSGHLMPRYYLLEEGINPTEDFTTKPNFSGSHDKTWKLVESGAYQAGALNEAVWERAVSENQVDTGKVEAFYTTPSYYDYNWTIHGDVNQKFGDETLQKVKEALLKLDADNENHKNILDLFVAEGFVETTNENYEPILDTAKKIDIIK